MAGLEDSGPRKWSDFGAFWLAFSTRVFCQNTRVGNSGQNGFKNVIEIVEILVLYYYHYFIPGPIES
jgi:hypothetical protein